MCNLHSTFLKVFVLSLSFGWKSLHAWGHSDEYMFFFPSAAGNTDLQWHVEDLVGLGPPDTTQQLLKIGNESHSRPCVDINRQRKKWGQKSMCLVWLLLSGFSFFLIFNMDACRASLLRQKQKGQCFVCIFQSTFFVLLECLWKLKKYSKYLV